MRAVKHCTLPALILLVAASGQSAPADQPKVTLIQPPDQGFFSKQAFYEGIPIKAHKDVSDKALLEARRRIGRMLKNLPVVVENLVDVGAEMEIIGKDQQTSDLPSQRHWKGKPYETHGSRALTIDQRTRGVGGLPASCGEENLLKLPSDRYKHHRDICTHEFAHTVFDYGLSANVRNMIEAQFKKSLGKGLWGTAYASTNPNEFFAELSMWYFGSRGDYGHIKPIPKEGRQWLRKYDPDAFKLLDRIYSGRVRIERITRETLAARPPEDEARLHSIASDHPTTVLFDNQTPTDLSLFWLDFQGKRKSYGTVRAGQKRFLNTFATHPWVVVNPAGKALGVFVPGEANGRVTLK
jgi:hypothetical protein